MTAITDGQTGLDPGWAGRANRAYLEFRPSTGKALVNGDFFDFALPTGFVGFEDFVATDVYPSNVGPTGWDNSTVFSIVAQTANTLRVGIATDGSVALHAGDIGGLIVGRVDGHLIDAPALPGLYPGATVSTSRDTTPFALDPILTITPPHVTELTVTAVDPTPGATTALLIGFTAPLGVAAIQSIYLRFGVFTCNVVDGFTANPPPPFLPGSDVISGFNTDPVNPELPSSFIYQMALALAGVWQMDWYTYDWPNVLDPGAHGVFSLGPFVNPSEPGEYEVAVSTTADSDPATALVTIGSPTPDPATLPATVAELGVPDGIPISALELAAEG